MGGIGPAGAMTYFMCQRSLVEENGQVRHRRDKMLGGVTGNSIQFVKRFPCLSAWAQVDGGLVAISHHATQCKESFNFEMIYTRATADVLDGI